ncbi:hypothetical protein CP970_09400 [Streptomyces kanamyceticus]|uniref:Uncharacterized protein n=1 Tax=Streptomyces kanamyceticus TaxID=1967 RepID=A0A5J6G7Y8_STRKN|nr:hypothetical protein CP970_09400 [Streptomyces kanamyceticus]
MGVPRSAPTPRLTASCRARTAPSTGAGRSRRTISGSANEETRTTPNTVTRDAVSAGPVEMVGPAGPGKR